MQKPLTTKTHGLLDYLSAPALLMLPRALQMEKKITNVLTAAALGVAGYSLITRYELGLFKLLPMKTHLLLDMMSGALVATAPFVFLQKEERDNLTIGLLLGIGAFEIAVANLTQTQPAPEIEGPDLTDALNDLKDRVQDALSVGS